jgi:hypothetical protein
MKNDELIKFQLKIDNGQMAYALLINKEFDLLEHWLKLGGKINNVNDFLNVIPHDYVLPTEFFNFIHPEKLDYAINSLPFENYKTNSQALIQIINYAEKVGKKTINFELNILSNLLQKGNWEYIKELSQEFKFTQECLTQFLFDASSSFSPKTVAKALLTLNFDFSKCNYGNYSSEILENNSSLWLYDLIKKTQSGYEQENSYDPDYGTTYSFKLNYNLSDYYLALTTELLNHVEVKDLENTTMSLFKQATFNHFLYELSEPNLKNYHSFLLTFLDKVQIKEFNQESLENLIEQTLKQSRYTRTHYSFWSNFVTPLFEKLSEQPNFNYFPKNLNYEYQFKDSPKKIKEIRKLNIYADNYEIRQEKMQLEKEIKPTTSHHKIKI